MWSIEIIAYAMDVSQMTEGLLNFRRSNKREPSMSYTVTHTERK